MGDPATGQPTGARVIHGQASLLQQSNSLVIITQNGADTKHSAIKRQSFSVRGGVSTRFAPQDPATPSLAGHRQRHCCRQRCDDCPQGCTDGLGYR
jgi:hypothetical protein